MAYQYPVTSGRINASIGGNSTSAGAGYRLISTGNMVLAGGTNITLSQNGQSISIVGGGGGGAALSAGTQSVSTGTVSFANSNGVTFGMAGSNQITASHNGITSQTNQALSASNGSFAFQTAGFSNANGVTFGTSAGSIMTASVNTSYAASNHSHGNPTLNLTNISGTTASASNGLTLSLSAASQTNQTIGGYATGNTTGQSSSSTFDARSMSMSGVGGVSLGYSGSMLQVSGPAISSLSQTGIISISRNGSTISIGAPAVSMGMSNIGNTAGTTGTVSNQLIFAGGNNVTLSQSTGAGGNTITISAGGGGGGVALYDGANSITSGTARISASGAVTASINGQTLSINAPAQSNLSATGAVSISTNGATISIGAPTQSAQTQSNIQGVIASGSTNRTGDISFLNGNGVTFGLSNNTITASVAAGPSAGIGAIANSNATYTSGTINLLEGGGAITIASTTGSKFNFSVPATSSISAIGALSISTNGSTVSMGVPAQSYLSANPGISLSSTSNTIYIGVPTVSTYFNMYPGSTASQTFGAMNATSASAQFYPVSVTGPVAFNALQVLMNMSFVSSNVSGAQSLTHQFGLYSNNAGTLSLISSNSLTYNVTISSVSATISGATATGTAGYSYGSVTASTTGQAQSLFGTVNARLMDLQFGNTMSVSSGMYWLGYLRKESSANAAGGISAGLIGNVIPMYAQPGILSSGQTSNSAGRGPVYLGFGPYNASTASIPGSVAISSIAHSGSVLPLMTFIST